MIRKTVLLSLSIATLVFLMVFFALGEESRSLSCLACDIGVVDKKSGENFDVEITFKNTGKTEGTWSVNIAVEDEAWTWCGTPKTLTLKSCHKETLTWNGNVLEDAPIDSMTRLIVYYGDSFEPLNWWIHVIDGAELTITSSTVE